MSRKVRTNRSIPSDWTREREFSPGRKREKELCQSSQRNEKQKTTKKQTKPIKMVWWDSPFQDTGLTHSTFWGQAVLGHKITNSIPQLYSICLLMGDNSQGFVEIGWCPAAMDLRYFKETMIFYEMHSLFVKQSLIMGLLKIELFPKTIGDL